MEKVKKKISHANLLSRLRYRCIAVPLLPLFLVLMNKKHPHFKSKFDQANYTMMSQLVARFH
jgi:hypothetical protein